MYDYELLSSKAEEVMKATEDVFNLKIPKGIKTNLILLHMKALQDGATITTIADQLNQLADQITISIGNKTIQQFDPVELYEYYVRKLKVDGIAFVGDGTGADNHFTDFIFPVFLCPQDKNAVDFMNPDYGFDGSKEVSIDIEYPADANEIDTRLMSAFAVSIPNSNPTKILEFISTTTTFSAVGEDQALALSQDSNKKLYEVFIKQTSFLAEGDTVDTRTLESLDYREGNESVHLHDMRLEILARFLDVSNSFATGAMRFDDQYPIIPFHHGDNAETSLPLKSNSGLLVKVGVAEAVIMTQLRIVPLSYY